MRYKTKRLGRTSKRHFSSLLHMRFVSRLNSIVWSGAFLGLASCQSGLIGQSNGADAAVVAPGPEDMPPAMAVDAGNVVQSDAGNTPSNESNAGAPNPGNSDGGAAAMDAGSRVPDRIVFSTYRMASISKGSFPPERKRISPCSQSWLRSTPASKI